MRRQKRKMTEFLVLAVVLSLTACSGKTTEVETETQSESTTEAEFAYKSHRLNLWVVSKITITSIARKFFMSIIIKNRKMDEREERWKWSGLHIN